MKLEQQVSNLALSKRLKELGVKQESIFHWIKAYYDEDDCYVDDPIWLITPKYTSSDSNIVDFVSAFTVAELGELLPRDFDYLVSTYEKNGYEGTRPLVFSSGKTILNEGWYVMYSDPHPENKVPMCTQHADTEADARAKMLIYLLENNLIELNHD